MLGFIWPHFKTKPISWSATIILIVLIAFATWINHCLWYLFALPVSCFFIAREWRAGCIVAICSFVGIFIGMLMTGHPFQLIYQTFGHFFHTIGDSTYNRQLVGELQPFRGDNIVVIAILVVLGWRALRNDLNIKIIFTPIFILAAVSWGLGFLLVGRVWKRWGIPAICVWMALQFDEYLNDTMNSLSVKRVWLTLAIACILFFSITNDIDSRWTENSFVQYLSLEKNDHKKWLPEDGGIIYSDDMTIFFQTFYANPHANWRYILGFEPTMMTPENFAVFRNIQKYFGAEKTYDPWIRKMRPQDRLILRRSSMPALSELEWNSPVSGIWVGRLP